MDDKMIEETYKKTINEEMPDLWNRIDAALPEKNVAVIRKRKKHRRWKYIWGGVAVAAAGILIFVGPVRWAMGLKMGSSGSFNGMAAYDTAVSMDSAPQEWGVTEEADEKEMYATTDDTADAGSGVGTVAEENSESGRKLIKTISMSVETLDFDTFTSQIHRQVEIAGGYFESATTETGNYGRTYNRYAYYTIRIPEQQLDIFTSTLGDIVHIVSTNESIEDITLKYTDTASHITALKTEQQRLLELLEQAESMEDILAIESKLTDIRYEMEYYQSMKNQYDNQISYATIHLDVSEVKEETVIEEQTLGQRMKQELGYTLRDIREGCQNLLVWIVANVPYIAVLVIIVVVVAGMVRRKVKKRK